MNDRHEFVGEVARRVSCVLGRVATVAIFLTSASSRTADAQVWTGTTTGGTSAWSSSANWLGSSVPTSGTGTTLQFFTDTTTPLSSGTITANNDLGGFTLGSLVLNGLSPATTGTTTVRLTGGSLTFGGPAPTIALNGRSSTGVLAYDIANNIAFNANTTISGTGNANFTLSGQLSGTGTITKLGSSTLQLNGDSSSTFSGGLVIGNGGGVTVNGGLGGKLPSNQSIALSTEGTFTYAGATTGTVGAVEVRSGRGIVAQSRGGSGGTGVLIVSSVSVAQGAMGLFSYTGGGSPGSDTLIRIANQSQGYLPANLTYSVGPVYYTGTGAAGSVGAVIYGTTPNSAALTGTQTSLGLNTGKHVQYKATSVASQVLTGTIGATQVTVTTPGNFSVGGIVSSGGVPAFTYVTAISGSTLTLSKALTGANPSVTSYTGVSAQTTDTIASLRFTGNGGSILLGASQTLTISSGGIYVEGNNSPGQLIAGGSGITTGGTNAIYYVSDSDNGGLSVQTPILATTTGGLVVAGASAALELAAANTFTGGVWLNSGNTRVAFAETAGTSGPLGASGAIRFSGGTLQYSSANTFDYSSRFSTEANQLYSVNTNTQNVTWAANLTSAGGTLTKASSGNLTLTGSNAFAGVTVNQNLVIIGNANALGTGTVTLAGGNAGLSADASPRTVTNPVVFAVSSASLQAATNSAALTLAGPVSFPSAITINVPSGAANPPDISGSITGSNTALSLGNGTNLILSGNNSGWTPASFSVDNGGITVGHPNALGSGSATYTTANAGRLVVNADLTGANARANNFVIGLDFTISGSQGLTVLGSVTNAAASDRTLANNIQSDKLLTLAGPVLLRNGTATAARTLTFAGTGNTTITGTVANGGVSGSASLGKAGSGILRLASPSTYTGTTSISAGILGIASTASLPGWDTSGRYSTAAGATLVVGDAVTDADFNTIRTSGNFVANAGIGFDVGPGGRTYSGATIANTAAGLLNLMKIGTGTLTMNVANTYTGTTTVREGVLRVGVAGALPANSPIVLNDTGLGSGSLDVGVSTTAGAVTVSGSGSSIFGVGTLTGASFTFSNSVGTVTASTVLAGTSATLTKSNAGTLVLSAANTYQGKTTVSGGTLEFASIANSGTANFSPLGAPTLANATIDLGSTTSSGTLRYLGSGHSSNRPINLAGTTGGGGIEANGSGALVLTGANTATGSGIKTFTLTGTNTGNNSIGAIAGSGVSVNKTGSGLWRLTGASSYSGQLTVSDGTLVVASAVDSGNGPFGSNTDSNMLPIIGSSTAGLSGTAALLVDGNWEIDRGMSIAALGAGSSQMAVLGVTGANTAIFGGGNNITLGRGVTLQASNSGTVTFANNWVNASVPVSFTIGSAGNDGVVVLESELPTSTGVSIVRGTARLQAPTDDRINPATPVTVGSSLGAATLDINGQSQTLSNLSFAGNSGSISGGTLRLASTPAVAVTGTGHTISSLVSLEAATSFNVNAASRLGISSAISGNFGLTKTGAGILELSGTSGYSGPTLVSGGSLLVNGQLDTSAVTVQSGGLLGGSGTLNGGVTVNAGGTLSPGNSPGLLTTSELVLAGATLMEIDGLSPRGGIGGYDAVEVTGALTYGGSMVIDFGSAITSALADNTEFNLFDFGSYTGLFSSITTANDSSWYGNLTFTGTGNKWTATAPGSQTLEFTHSTGVLVIVPEPGALALAGIGIAAAAYAARSRSPSRKRAG